VGHSHFAAPGEAIAQGLQPKGASSTLATFAQSQNPFGRELAPLLTRFRAQTPVRYPLFVGCSALVKVPQLIDDALVVSEAFGAPVGVGKASERCCGYPLYAAGALEAFATHAAATARAFAQYHELVVLDPGCAWTLKVAWAQVGVTPRARVRTLIEVLAENLPHAPTLPPLSQKVGYHDACKLGRGLGVYDEPRALLARAVESVGEAPSCRADGGCAGAGGLLPRTMPETAVEVARRQAAQVARGGEAIVSACPNSTRMFARAGREAIDLVSLLRRWLSQSEGTA
jgi:Fe-S oxidoreductase